MADIAMALDRLVPGADWQGSVTAGTKAAYDAIRWNDDRPKPSWQAVKDASAAIAAEPPPTDGDLANKEIDRSPAMKGLVRLLGKRFNLTEQQVRDAIKVELQ